MRLLLTAFATTTLVVLIGAAGGGRGQATASHAVRPGGINVEPSMRPWRYHGPNPDGWWCRGDGCNGVANGTVFVDRELRLISKLGARLLRVEFPWPLIEPRRNVFDWRRADYIVRRARRYHVHLLPVLLYTPRWEAPNESDPPDPGSYATFVAAAAHRYRASLDSYELWNEPDLERYWDAGPDAYVTDVLEPGYRAVKEQDPRARVVLGGPATADLQWLDAIYRFGGGNAFDVMSFHDYSGDSSILAHAQLVQGALTDHGQTRKPIWLGEYGLQEPGMSDVRQQALVRLILTAKAPIKVASWYSLRDDHVMSCCPPQTIKDESYGLTTSGYQPKAAFATMRHLLARARSGSPRRAYPWTARQRRRRHLLRRQPQ